MGFKPDDKVRLKRSPRTWLAVKCVSDDDVLCELWAGSEINAGIWPAEALEPVKTFKRGEPKVPGRWSPRV